MSETKARKVIDDDNLSWLTSRELTRAVIRKYTGGICRQPCDAARHAAARVVRTGIGTASGRCVVSASQALSTTCFVFMRNWRRDPEAALAQFCKHLRTVALDYPPGMIGYLTEGVQQLRDRLREDADDEFGWQYLAVRIEAVRSELDDCPGEGVSPSMAYLEDDPDTKLCELFAKNRADERVDLLQGVR
jgi:hypothetical protein